MIILSFERLEVPRKRGSACIIMLSPSRLPQVIVFSVMNGTTHTGSKVADINLFAGVINLKKPWHFGRDVLHNWKMSSKRNKGQVIDGDNREFIPNILKNEKALIL